MYHYKTDLSLKTVDLTGNVALLLMLTFVVSMGLCQSAIAGGNDDARSKAGSNITIVAGDFRLGGWVTMTAQTDNRPDAFYMLMQCVQSGEVVLAGVSRLWRDNDIHEHTFNFGHTNSWVQGDVDCRGSLIQADNYGRRKTLAITPVFHVIGE